MSRKWLIVGGVGLVVLVIIASTLFLGGPKGNACEQLIRSAIDNKPGDSYGLLTPELRATVSEENWKDSIEGWYSAYATSSTEFELTSTEAADQSSDTPQSTREIYTITTATGVYRGSCYLDDQGQITGYSSEVDTSRVSQ